jgi:glyoxylase-like metal-dependent hydrolase (beta-lactamase superfamily II)
VGISAVVSPFLDENCYVVADPASDDAVVVDPGVATARAVIEHVRRAGLRPVAVLLTHAHPDHAWDAAAVSVALGVDVHISAGDRALLADPLAGLAAFGLPAPGQLLGAGPEAVWQPPAAVTYLELADAAAVELTLGSIGLRALACPGHTRGSAVFEVRLGEGEPFLLTGDVLFANGIGRTDLPGGNPVAMRASLRRLVATFAGSRRFWPGHGPGSTIGRELMSNPYLADALEV